MLKHSQGHQNGKKTTRSWICHHCKRKGHIRPFCYKLYVYPKQSEQKSSKSEMRNVKKEWKPKTPNVSSSMTSSVLISVPPVLTKYRNLGQSSLNVADADNNIKKDVFLSTFKVVSTI